MNKESCLASIPGKLQDHLSSGPLVDIFEDLIIGTLIPNRHEHTTRLTHPLHRLEFQVHPDIAIPFDPDIPFYDLFTKLDHPLMASRKSIVLYSDLPDLRHVFNHPLKFISYALRRTRPIFPPVNRLGIAAEGTPCHTTPRCHNLYFRVVARRKKILSNIEVFLVDLTYKWEFIKIFYKFPF